MLGFRRRRSLKFLSLMVLAISVMAMPAKAALLPVFEYSFPASNNGTGTAIIDLSATGNDATLGGATNAVSLLDNSTIDDFGGYVMDV